MNEKDDQAENLMDKVNIAIKEDNPEVKSFKRDRVVL